MARITRQRDDADVVHDAAEGSGLVRHFHGRGQQAAEAVLTRAAALQQIEHGVRCAAVDCLATPDLLEQHHHGVRRRGIAGVGGDAVVRGEARLERLRHRIAAQRLAEIVARQVFQLRRVATAVVEDQLLARAVDADPVNAQAPHACGDFRGAGLGETDVGGGVVADHHHQVREVPYGQRNARRIVDGCEVAAAKMLVTGGDLHHLVPLQGPRLRHRMQFDEHRELEGARHRKRAVTVDLERNVALEVLDRDTDHSLRERHGLLDAALQPVEVPIARRRLSGGEGDVQRCDDDDGSAEQRPGTAHPHGILQLREWTSNRITAVPVRRATPLTGPRSRPPRRRTAHPRRPARAHPCHRVRRLSDDLFEC